MDSNRDEITIKDKPKDKEVHKDVPENIKSFLKEKIKNSLNLNYQEDILYLEKVLFWMQNHFQIILP